MKKPGNPGKPPKAGKKLRNKRRADRFDWKTFPGDLAVSARAGRRPSVAPGSLCK